MGEKKSYLMYDFAPEVETAQSLLDWAQKELSILGDIEAQASAEWLLAEVLDCRRADLYIDLEKPLTKEQAKKFRRLVGRRRKRIPVAYLCSKAFFWNETLEVNSNCLIPRPETELLIEKFISHSGFCAHDTFSFLDLGTGTGAIGLSLLRHFYNAHGTLSDVSEKALNIASRNIRQYSVETRSEIIESNLFESLKERKWNAIFSNPPYFSQRDWQTVEPEIFCEPDLALDGGVDGLDFYRAISEQASQYLTNFGWLVLELGAGQIDAVKTLLEEQGFEVKHSFRDYAEIDRVLMAQWVPLNHG